MPFRITKRLDLSYLGTEWNDCYLEFESLSVKDTKRLAEMQIKENATQEQQVEASEKVQELLKEKFVSGKAYDNGEVVTVKKSDLDEMPLEIIPKAIETLIGTNQKN